MLDFDDRAKVVKADSDKNKIDPSPDYEVFAAMYPSLRRLAAAVRPPHVDADDLVQDALVRVLDAGGLDRLVNPQAYLSKTILSLAADRRRSWTTRYRRGRLLSSGPIHDSYPSDLDDLLSLDPRERAVVFLRDVEGEEYERIAKVLGVSESAARKRVQRGRKRLSLVLAESSRRKELG